MVVIGRAGRGKQDVEGGEDGEYDGEQQQTGDPTATRRRVCLGYVSGTIQAIACTSRTSWEQIPGRTPKSSEQLRVRVAREVGTKTFVECLGIFQEDTVEGSLWKETLCRHMM